MKWKALLLIAFLTIIVCYDYSEAYDLGNINWNETTPLFSPESRSEFAMTYDSDNNKVVLFGGTKDYSLDYGEVWTYNTKKNKWTDLGASNGPGARRDMSLVYDAESKKIIMQGGFHNNSFFNDTWVYDVETNLWANMNPLNRPDIAADYSMVYDSLHDKVIVYGGRKQNGLNINETWSYDLNTNTWQNRNPLFSPQPRGNASQSMVYDSQNDKIILFGGCATDGVTFLNDTWVYDYVSNTWSQMTPVVSPSIRRNSAMVYDSEIGKSFLFGGFGGADTNWMYDFLNDTWQEIYPKDEPSYRLGHDMVYNSVDDRVVLFGGNGTNETWEGKLKSRQNNAPVPEPATLLLLGTGLLGAKLIRRKSK